MSDSIDSLLDSPGKRVRLGRALEGETVAAAAGLPVMKCGRGTGVRHVTRQVTKQDHLNNAHHDN